jgi:hypothetical protein
MESRSRRQNRALEGESRWSTETRQILGRAVGGNVWRKRGGLALFLIGLVVQTVGNVVSS